MNKKLAYAIPNFFTVGSLISALFALTLASSGNYVNSAWLITLSIILDGLDGKMARLLHATSKLGAQADSLSDFVAFGVVPGFLAWKCCLYNYGFIGFVIFIAYILCGGFRLARFNVMLEKTTIKTDFTGLPIPGAAAIVASYILFDQLILVNTSILPLLLFILPFISFLMVSMIPYVAVTKGKTQKRQKNMMIVVACLLIVAMTMYFIWVYFIISWVYIIYGLFNLIKSTHKRKYMAEDTERPLRKKRVKGGTDD